MEALLVWLGLLGAQVALGRRAQWPARLAVLVVTLAAPLAVRGIFPGAEASAMAPSDLPHRLRSADRVGSEACRACHPGPYASWHRSHHRTMTQPARLAEPGTPATFLGPVPATVDVAGERFTLDRRGGTVLVRRGNGGAEPVAMTTGSHHYQAAWTKGARPGELRVLPFVFLRSEERYVPRASVFLTPPTQGPNDLPWSSSCIMCHAVGGEPHRSPEGDRFDTTTSELGIACEACHGPGGAHVRRHRSPVARARASGKRDDSIVNPARLDGEASVAVCAQCHALFLPKDEAVFWARGVTSPSPPEPWKTRDLITLDGLRGPLAGRVEADAESFFWRDGTARIGGREGNAHLLSPCYLRGEGAGKATCLSCHAMHDSEPSMQIARSRAGDAMCTSCHKAVGRDVARHTHHAPASPGSRCVSCHMPKTTFALLRAMPSHRVETPSEVLAKESGRLPACNLCHVGRDLGWTARTLASWRGGPEPASDDGSSSSLTSWALRGNAAERALAADHLSAALASDASSAFALPLLGLLADDDYAAVRHVALRGLRRDDRFRDLAVDFVVAPGERPRVADAVAARFDALGLGRSVPEGDRRAVGLDAHGRFDVERAAAALRLRDNRPITLAE